MIFNVGYLTGMTGRRGEYVTHAGQFFFRHTKRRERIAQNITKLTEEEKPDILFLEEVWNDRYMAHVKKQFTESHVDIKYKPGGFFRLPPFFRGHCNGLFLRDPGQVSKLFLKNGAKKLVYQVDIHGGPSLFFSHLALGKNTRKKQFAELSSLVCQKDQVLVAGDFNIFKGVSEIEGLLRSANLNIANDLSCKTFPAYRPKHAIDLFLVSPTIIVKQVKVLDNIQLSDHLPVLIDIEV